MQTQSLQEVKTKFEAFVAEAEKTRADLIAAQQEVKNLKQELAAKYEEVTALQTNLSNRTIAQVVVGNGNTDTHEARQKITELMREIDQCIALLNV